MIEQSEIEYVARALKDKFKKIVEESSGQTFAETKVAMPHDSIWNSYAEVAIEALLFNRGML